MAIVIILKDDNHKLYVNETQALVHTTNDVDKAAHFTSLEQMLMTVPIMKDWNWDFCVYAYNTDNRHQELIKEDVWTPIYKQLKEDGKLRY